MLEETRRKAPQSAALAKLAAASRDGWPTTREAIRRLGKLDAVAARDDSPADYGERPETATRSAP